MKITPGIIYVQNIVDRDLDHPSFHLFHGCLDFPRMSFNHVSVSCQEVDIRNVRGGIGTSAPHWGYAFIWTGFDWAPGPV